MKLPNEYYNLILKEISKETDSLTTSKNPNMSQPNVYLQGKQRIADENISTDQIEKLMRE